MEFVNPEFLWFVLNQMKKIKRTVRHNAAHIYILNSDAKDLYCLLFSLLDVVAESLECRLPIAEGQDFNSQSSQTSDLSN